jgi:hypothetical protein
MQFGESAETQRGVDGKSPRLKERKCSTGLRLPRRPGLFGLWIRGALHPSPAIELTQTEWRSTRFGSLVSAGAPHRT